MLEGKRLDRAGARERIDRAALDSLTVSRPAAMESITCAGKAPRIHGGGAWHCDC